jgi:hypothetical protein
MFSSVRTRFPLQASRVKNPGSDRGIRQNQIQKASKTGKIPAFYSTRVTQAVTGFALFGFQPHESMPKMPTKR